MLTFVISRAVAGTIGKPEALKSSLSGSGFYENLPKQLYVKLRQSAKNNTQIGTVALNRPVVEEAFLQTLSPDRLRQLTESSLDSIYESLETGSEPRFSLDLTEIKQSFAESVANKASSRLAGLPICTSAPASTDPFEITCRPPGLNIQTESDRIKNELLNSHEFLPETVITLDTLRSGQLSKTEQIKEQHQKISNAHQWMMRLPLIAGLLSLLVATLMIFVSPKRLSGIKRVFVVMITVGMGLIAGALLAKTFVIGELKSKLSSEAPLAIFDATQAITLHVLREILIYSASGAIIGLLALIGIAIFRQRNNPTPLAPSKSVVGR